MLFIRIEDSVTLLFRFHSHMFQQQRDLHFCIPQFVTGSPADTTSMLGYSCLCYGVSNRVQLCCWPLHVPLLFGVNRIEYWPCFPLILNGIFCFLSRIPSRKTMYPFFIRTQVEYFYQVDFNFIFLRFVYVIVKRIDHMYIEDSLRSLVRYMAKHGGQSQLQALCKFMCFLCIYNTFKNYRFAK